MWTLESELSAALYEVSETQSNAHELRADVATLLLKVSRQKQAFRHSLQVWGSRLHAHGSTTLMALIDSADRISTRGCQDYSSHTVDKSRTMTQDEDWEIEVPSLTDRLTRVDLENAAGFLHSESTSCYITCHANLLQVLKEKVQRESKKLQDADASYNLAVARLEIELQNRAQQAHKFMQAITQLGVTHTVHHRMCRTKLQHQASEQQHAFSASAAMLGKMMIVMCAGTELAATA